MRIPNFSVQSQRNIKLAACDDVPRIMIVTGPNGCGKSTLLQALRGTGTNRPMYIGPHRASRRQRVRYRYLGPEIRMRNVLEGEKLPGYEGITGVSTTRNPWDFDDAASFLKYSLCQIELDRREAIADVYSQHNEIKKGSLPDVWTPLHELAENLLPHLRFEKIDTGNREQVQCLWTVEDSDSPIDIDDLSSRGKIDNSALLSFSRTPSKSTTKGIEGREIRRREHHMCADRRTRTAPTSEPTD